MSIVYDFEDIARRLPKDDFYIPTKVNSNVVFFTTTCPHCHRNFQVDANSELSSTLECPHCKTSYNI